ncbi:hypothetical protein Pint_16588 [Pistacia integerrima]|uniref:Uncharacterized protein n=1 Tax=Pistacia integerrima TaxID=434235 RepID=A0ACC0ZFZ7_9ROSI|nr:hypothetical protein Pint_16588 [Pistacia integerrima]
MEFKNSTEGAVLRVLRDAPPSHYLLKIQSFSSLTNLNKFISNNFDAGGFKWKLCLYPNGDKENKGEDGRIRHFQFNECRMGLLQILGPGNLS